MTEPLTEAGLRVVTFGWLDEKEVAAIEAESAAHERERMKGLVEAAIRIRDKRTADSDGFWVSLREMRYLEQALAEWEAHGDQ